MNNENIQEMWSKAKENIKSVFGSIKNKTDKVSIETQDYIRDESDTSGEYNYDKESETGQAERYS